MPILAFEEEACRDVARAGGKGASLARMTALGLPVPPGFVISADELAAALADGGEQLRALAVAQDHEGASRIAREAALDAGARDAMLAAYAELAAEEDATVAVRSSACQEDSEAASFAGQQETYLHVRGGDDVRRRVRDCWASFFSERALFYRGQKGSLEDLGMAVVVQRMVAADVAGVLFTIDPVRRRRDQMVVEAVFGLGEAVVSGEVTPDHYVLRRDGRVKRSTLTVQPYAIVAAAAGGVEERPLDEQAGAAATLTEAQLAALAAMGADLEERLGGPQDIEWALEGETLYVLQARPVTT